MPLRLKGAHPQPGEVDRRYYMLDVQVSTRRERLSTGTRNHDLAARREQAVVDAMKDDPEVSREALLILARGERIGSKIAKRELGNLTLEEAFNRALKDPDVWGQLASGGTDYATSANVIYKYIPRATKITALDTAKLKECRDKMLSGRRPATVNRKMVALRHVLKACAGDVKGQTEGYIPGYSLPKFPSTLVEDGSRKFVLTFEQEAAIIAAVRAHDLKPDPIEGRKFKRDGADYAELFEVIADTGVRLGEALRIDPEDINPAERYVRVWSTRWKRTKTGSSRTVPLTDAAYAVLERRMAATGGKARLFAGMNKRRAQEHWAMARKEVGITNPECVIHGLRHTFATRVLERTGDLSLVKELLGHSDIATTTIYAKVLTKHARAGIDSLQAMRDKAESQVTALGDVTPIFRDRNHSETEMFVPATAANS